MTGLGDIGRIDGDGFSFACEILADDKGVVRSGMAMNNFMVSMNVFSKGLCIFTTDLRADRHSDWYCIRSVSLAIIR